MADSDGRHRRQVVDSQDVLAIEHSEYYKQLIGEDEWCEEEI